MSKIYDVVVLVGSLRKESLNRKMAKALATISPATLKLDIVEIGQLPHYNQDLEADLPGEYIAFRQRIAAANALLFITPEYNRSVPGGSEERNRRGVAPFRQECMERQTCRGD